MGEDRGGKLGRGEEKSSVQQWEINVHSNLQLKRVVALTNIFIMSCLKQFMTLVFPRICQEKKLRKAK